MTGTSLECEVHIEFRVYAYKTETDSILTVSLFFIKFLKKQFIFGKKNYLFIISKSSRDFFKCIFLSFLIVTENQSKKQYI